MKKDRVDCSFACCVAAIRMLCLTLGQRRPERVLRCGREYGVLGQRVVEEIQARGKDFT